MSVDAHSEPVVGEGTEAVVAGLGVSGEAAARALAERGARVRALDAGRSPEVAERAEALAAEGVEVQLGADFSDADALAGADLLVPSPGVPESNALVQAALRGGVAVWSEPELGWRLAPPDTRLVVVTGTNGKTTTTELLAALLGAPAGGNIGVPLTALLAGDDPPPLVVAELSSFQLRFTVSLGADVTVLLNVAPDHLDWHATTEAYVAAKAQAWARPRGPRVLVLGDDEGARAALRAHPFHGRVRRVRNGPPRAEGEVGVGDGTILLLADGRTREIAEVSALALQGPHNLANVCAAVAAATAAGADPGALAPTLASFRAGPHRLALVAERGGVAWVDDSKATNPHAAAAALAAYGTGQGGLVWIAGGLAKGLDFDTLAEPVARYVRHAITIGTSGPTLAALARDAGVEVTEAGTLDRAVTAAARLARPADTVLLAPACASMDQFVDYAARGRAFADAVAALDREGVR